MQNNFIFLTDFCTKPKEITKLVFLKVKVLSQVCYLSAVTNFNFLYFLKWTPKTTDPKFCVEQVAKILIINTSKPMIFESKNLVNCHYFPYLKQIFRIWIKK